MVKATALLVVGVLIGAGLAVLRQPDNVCTSLRPAVYLEYR